MAPLARRLGGPLILCGSIVAVAGGLGWMRRAFTAHVITTSLATQASWMATVFLLASLVTVATLSRRLGSRWSAAWNAKGLLGRGLLVVAGYASLALCLTRSVSHALSAAGVAVLLTAASEEVVFRGVLPAAIRGLVADGDRSRWRTLSLAVLAQVTFAMAHLVVVPRGLEASISEGARLVAAGLFFQHLAQVAGVHAAVVVHATLNLLLLADAPGMNAFDERGLPWLVAASLLLLLSDSRRIGVAVAVTPPTIEGPMKARKISRSLAVAVLGATGLLLQGCGSEPTDPSARPSVPSPVVSPLGRALPTAQDGARIAVPTAWGPRNSSEAAVLAVQLASDIHRRAAVAARRGAPSSARLCGIMVEALAANLPATPTATPSDRRETAVRIVGSIERCGGSRSPDVAITVAPRQGVPRPGLGPIAAMTTDTVVPATDEEIDAWAASTFTESWAYSEAMSHESEVYAMVNEMQAKVLEEPYGIFLAAGIDWGKVGRAALNGCIQNAVASVGSAAAAGVAAARGAAAGGPQAAFFAGFGTAGAVIGGNCLGGAAGAAAAEYSDQKLQNPS